jgi:hypothetical protein
MKVLPYIDPAGISLRPASSSLTIIITENILIIVIKNPLTTLK